MNNVVGIITARSGSKGIPNKNIRTLGDMPLLGWVVKALTKSKLSNKIILSTDSENYFNIAKSFNDKILLHKRSNELSGDEISSDQVILDVTEKFKEIFSNDTIIVMIQPTTPFITGKDIDNCVELLLDNHLLNSCMSVRRVSEHPEWMFGSKNNEKILVSLNDSSKSLLRQKLNIRWIPNGGIYAVRLSFLKKSHKIVDVDGTLIYEMPKLRSIDIDEEDDFVLCSALVDSGKIKPDD